MENIRRKIQSIESDIQYNQKSLQMNMSLLNKKIHEPKFLFFAIATGFVTGYLLGSKENRNIVKGKIAQTPSLLLKIFEHVKVLLPLISL
jgi:hypothetical protein